MENKKYEKNYKIYNNIFMNKVTSIYTLYLKFVKEYFN